MFTIDGVEYDRVVGSSEVRIRCENELKVGQLIKAYHSGYHVITKIESRPDEVKSEMVMELKEEPGQVAKYVPAKKSVYYYGSPLVYYVRVFNDKYELLKKPGKETCCDGVYCRPITNEYIDELVRHIRTESNRAIDNLENVVSLYVKES